MNLNQIVTINSGTVEINDEQICYVAKNKQDPNIIQIVMSCGTHFDVLETDWKKFLKKNKK